MQNDRVGYIDALKGLAILWVTMIHTGGGDLPGILGTIGVNGARGVQMFFVLSGMLAFGSLHRFFEAPKKMAFGDVAGWYWKKAIRLIPLYYIALVTSMMMGSWNVHWLGNEGHVTALNILAHIFLVHGLFPHYTDSILGVEWYVGVLSLYFLISPLLYKFIDSLERAIVFLIAIFALNPLFDFVLALLLPIEDDPVIYKEYLGTFSPFAQLLPYALGIALYYMIEGLQKAEIKNARVLSYSLLLWGGTMLFGQINGSSSIFALPGYELFGVWFCVIIVSQALHGAFFIDNLVFRFLGKYSYGIYLFQYIWLDYYGRLIEGQKLTVSAWAGKFFVSVFALLVISFLLTHFLDKPIQEALKRLKFMREA